MTQEELKAYGMDDPEIGDEYEMYKVSEVDAVLAEKDKEIAELKQKLAAAQQVLRLNEPKALYSNLETMGRLKHETDVVARRERHHKYKRCLAMARWCECRWADIATQYYKSVLYRKWQLRWLELAEKFKEAK